MKKVKFIPVLFFCSLMALLFFLKNKEEERLINAMENSLEEIHQKVEKDLPLEHKILNLQFTQQQLTQLNLLKNNFDLYTFNGESTWLKHQGFIKNKAQDSLMAIINQHGEVNLFSNYIGDSPLAHYAIQLKIGETYIDSINVVSSTNPYISSTIIQIQESICLKAENAKRFIELIATNKNAEIEVRLIGKDAYTSFTLSNEDKRAFNETWELLSLFSA